MSKVVTAEDVRAWARKRGLDVAEHGRLSAEVISAFNKAHRAVSYAPTMNQPARLVKVAGTPARRGSFPRTVQTTYPQVRAWASQRGISLGVRGRIPTAVLSQYADAH